MTATEGTCGGNTRTHHMAGAESWPSFCPNVSNRRNTLLTEEENELFSFCFFERGSHVAQADLRLTVLTSDLAFFLLNAGCTGMHHKHLVLDDAGDRTQGHVHVGQSLYRHRQPR